MAMSIASTRLDEDTERRVDAMAERRGMTRSDWLRHVVMNAIAAETQAVDQALTFVDISKRLKVLEKDLSDSRRIGDRVLGSLTDLSNTLAVERAADRAVARQIYRMALRAAWLGIKSFRDNASEEERHGLGGSLCDQADEVYEGIGLTRLDDEMREARAQIQQNIERLSSS